MSKRKDNWCEGQHKRPETKFVIEETSKALQKDIEDYILHDMDIESSEPVKRRFVYDRMKSILDQAEYITAIVVDANSVYALYACDFENRRIKWLNARGSCYRIIAMLNGISRIVHKNTNLSKYARMCKEYENLAEKIKNIMYSDDKKRKEHCKEY